MGYDGPERRKSKRIKVSFVVSYRPLEKEEYSDLSQTRNFSEGGILLTTNTPFKEGTLLKMFIRVPMVREKINVIGRVIESKEVVKNLIYETRIGFQDVDEKTSRILKETVGGFVKEKEGRDE